jgi:hypothetical protein
MRIRMGKKKQNPRKDCQEVKGVHSSEVRKMLRHWSKCQDGNRE